jgi:hypothetical protein
MPSRATECHACDRHATTRSPNRRSVRRCLMAGACLHPRQSAGSSPPRRNCPGRTRNSTSCRDRTAACGPQDAHRRPTPPLRHRQIRRSARKLVEARDVQHQPFGAQPTARARESHLHTETNRSAQPASSVDRRVDLTVLLRELFFAFANLVFVFSVVGCADAFFRAGEVARHPEMTTLPWAQ